MSLILFDLFIYLFYSEESVFILPRNEIYNFQLKCSFVIFLCAVACMLACFYFILNFKIQIHKIDTHLYAWKCFTKWHTYWQFIVFMAVTNKIGIFTVWNVVCWKTRINKWHRTKLTFHLNKSQRQTLIKRYQCMCGLQLCTTICACVDATQREMIK